MAFGICQTTFAPRSGSEPCPARSGKSPIYAGMPRMIKAMRAYPALMKDLGLLELSEPVFHGDARE